jgi:hypothetical protein
VYTLLLVGVFILSVKSKINLSFSHTYGTTILKTFLRSFDGLQAICVTIQCKGMGALRLFKCGFNFAEKKSAPFPVERHLYGAEEDQITC